MRKTGAGSRGSFLIRFVWVGIAAFVLGAAIWIWILTSSGAINPVPEPKQAPQSTTGQKR